MILSKTNYVKDLLLDRHYNNNVMKYHNTYLVVVSNISFVADKSDIFNFSETFKSQIKYENGTRVCAYDKKLEDKIFIDLYKQFTENEFVSIIQQNDDFCIICKLEHYQTNAVDKKEEKEDLYVLKYMVQYPMLEMVEEYNTSVNFHNNIACKLCKALTKLIGDTVSPSYIEYNIGVAYVNESILIANQAFKDLLSIDSKIKKLHKKYERKQ